LEERGVDEKWCWFTFDLVFADIYEGCRLYDITLEVEHHVRGRGRLSGFLTHM
jgi:hypothetical protein